LAKERPSPTSRIGWHTSEVLKEKMVKDLSEAITDGLMQPRELETWREMTHFIRDPRTGRLGARRGHRDDGIMCTAIGLQGALAPRVGSHFPSFHQIIIPTGGTYVA